MKDWKEGDPIEHPLHGAGTVRFVGSEYLGIEFAEGRQALLRVAVLEEGSATEDVDEAAAPEIEAQPPADAPWPDGTFLADAEEHSMGSHWRPFFEDFGVFLRDLPQLFPQAKPFLGWGDFFRSPREKPAHWPEGLAMCWPDPHAGLMLVLAKQDDQLELLSLFPYCEHGNQVQLVLQAVHVWEGGVEAQIEATWGEAGITFFDAAFLANRLWYEQGKTCEFILLGIAYAARPAQAQHLPYAPHPDQVAWEAMLARAEGREPEPPPAELRLGGMAMLLPIPEWDRDDCHFRGPIREVTELADVLGQRAWRVVATVMRFGDEPEGDADLAILVTERAWEGEAPPTVGEDIEGTLWLQGRLREAGRPARAPR